MSRFILKITHIYHLPFNHFSLLLSFPPFQWRQISEPNDPVWWVDLLTPEQFSAGFGSQTSMFSGYFYFFYFYFLFFIFHLGLILLSSTITIITIITTTGQTKVVRYSPYLQRSFDVMKTYIVEKHPKHPKIEVCCCCCCVVVVGGGGVSSCYVHKSLLFYSYCFF